MEIRVWNDAVATKAPQNGKPSGTRVGISNLGQRLEILFPGRARLEAGFITPDQFESRLRLPISVEAGDESADC